MTKRPHDVVVIGAGPNGLAAGIRLARRGRSVVIVEAAAEPGGGARSAPLTLPGFTHDICSGVHPMAAASPFFQALPLREFGLEWIQPPIALAHPLADGRVACLLPSLDETAETLGRDGPAYRRWLAPWVFRRRELFEDILGPLRLPRHPLLLASFARWATRSGRSVATALFADEPARCLLGGLSAHSFLPVDQAPSAAIGIVLGVAGHSVGWPFPRGGAQKITGALAAYFRSLGGEIVVDHPVRGLGDLPPAPIVLFDLVPREVLRIAGDRLPPGYRRALGRFRHGPGAFKVDWALSGPIPWTAAECRRAGTLHLAGSFDELAASEEAAWNGVAAERPFVLLSQPSLFDPTRAPDSKHTAWAYCHVPPGSSVDMTARIETQIERFAPGFRDLILARHTFAPAALEEHNPNLVGGDLSGGTPDWRQLFFRPARRLAPYAMPVSGWFICSSSTPPGAGVHGMCGYHAAGAAMKRFPLAR